MTFMGDQLVQALDAEGVAVSAVSLANLTATAQRVGVSPILLEVLLDGQAPICARIRSYGRVASQVYARSSEVFGAVLDRRAVDLAA